MDRSVAQRLSSIDNHSDKSHNTIPEETKNHIL